MCVCVPDEEARALIIAIARSSQLRMHAKRIYSKVFESYIKSACVRLSLLLHLSASAAVSILVRCSSLSRSLAPSIYLSGESSGRQRDKIGNRVWAHRCCGPAATDEHCSLVPYSLELGEYCEHGTAARPATVKRGLAGSRWQEIGRRAEERFLSNPISRKKERLVR